MDDLIRRSDALGCFHDWIDEHGYIHEADEMTEYQAIEALPSVVIGDPTQSNASNTLDALTNACPLCGGTLSEIRESNGKKYRHCYSCHMEQEVKE